MAGATLSVSVLEPEAGVAMVAGENDAASFDDNPATESVTGTL